MIVARSSGRSRTSSPRFSSGSTRRSASPGPGRSSAVTIAVRMLLVPLAVRQIHSMQSLQIHAPEMKAIQQRYKHDRQKQSEELMKFYKENKINPYASCLPIVFQIPIFIALFFVLRDFEEEVFCSPELGGETYCETVDGNLQVLPEYESQLEWLNLVNITADTVDGWGPLLLVIYVVSQLTSTWLMSTSMQSAAQRWLIMLLPIVFIPFILEFPSGLMIYWLTTNLWTTGQGLVTRRLMPQSRDASEADEPHAAEGGHGRCGRRRGRRGGDGAGAGSVGPATPRQAQEGRRRAHGDERGRRRRVRVEATGETVGEAKWTALRELEQLVPGLDRDSVAVRRPLRGRARPPRRRIHARRGWSRPFREPAAAAPGARQRGLGIGARVRRPHRVGDRRRRHGRPRPSARGRDGDVHGRRPRPPDRKARADDRRDPVPRERGRALRGRRARRRRRRRRLPRSSRGDARRRRGPLGAPGCRDGQPGRARSR